MITKVEELTKEIVELKRRISAENGIQLESENSLATQKTVESAASTNNEIDTEVNVPAENPLALQTPTEPLSENNEGANTGASTNYESDIEEWAPTPQGEVNPLALKKPTEPLSENNEGANTGASTNYDDEIEQWTESLPPTPRVNPPPAPYQHMTGNTPQFKESVFTQDIKDLLPKLVGDRYNTLNSIIKRANEKRGMFEKRRDQDKAKQVDALAKSLKEITTNEGLMEFLQKENGKNKRALEVLKGGAKTRKRKQKKQRNTKKR